MKSTGWLADKLHVSVGKFVHLETVEGAVRSGRLSGLRLSTFLVNEEVVDVVKEVELNGDPSDTIAIDSLKSLTIDP